MPISDWIVLAGLLTGVLASIGLKKLTVSAALTGGCLGGLVYAGGGLTGLLLLAVFFMLGTTATSWKKNEKGGIRANAGHQSTRTTGQVIANAGIAALCGLGAVLRPSARELLQLMMAGSLSAAMADTLSSELGMVYGRRFYNILSWKPDEKGQDGVVSIEGLLIGVAGSAIIAGLYTLGHRGSTCHRGVYPPSSARVYTFWTIALAGTIGNLADSLLGALLERKGFLSNNAVNFGNTLVGALTAGIFEFFYQNI